MAIKKSRADCKNFDSSFISGETNCDYFSSQDNNFDNVNTATYFYPFSLRLSVNVTN